jgi:hypothetical protein
LPLALFALMCATFAFVAAIISLVYR